MKKVVLLLIAALVVGVATSQAQSKKRSGKRVARTAAKAASYDFTGTYENSFKDYDGNPVMTYLAINYDAAKGEATGEYKNDEGEVIPIVGKMEGGKLKCHQADPNADILNQVDLTMHFYNNNQLKVDEVTGSFKRTSSEYTAIELRQKDAPQSSEPTKSLQEAGDAVRQAAAAGQPIPTP